MREDKDRYMTAQDVADLYHVTVRTVWRWRDSGKLREAKRAGKAVLFDRQEVEALGSADDEGVTLADVYMALATADTWERVWGIRDQIAATLCSQADERGTEAIRSSWEAACGMAATHPDEDARGRWADTARRYGKYMGMTWEETDEAIASHGESYEEAALRAKESPYDPAYTVAYRTAHGEE